MEKEKTVNEEEIVRFQSNNELKKLIVAGEEIKGVKAGRKLLAQNPTNDDLCYILIRVGPLRREVEQKLLLNNPSNDDLICIVGWGDKAVRKAWKMLNHRATTAQELRSIVRKVRYYELSSGRRLLNQFPTIDNLLFLIDYSQDSEKLREEVGKKLLEKKSNTDLDRMISKLEYVEEMEVEREQSEWEDWGYYPSDFLKWVRGLLKTFRKRIEVIPENALAL